jgi:hypothetical protein
MATVFRAKPIPKHVNGNREAVRSIDFIQCFPAHKAHSPNNEHIFSVLTIYLILSCAIPHLPYNLPKYVGNPTHDAFVLTYSPTATITSFSFASASLSCSLSIS